MASPNRPVPSRVKKFSVNSAPKEFELLGEVFQAAPELDYRVYDNIVNRETDPERGVFAELIIDNIADMLVDEEEGVRFKTKINDPDTVISFKTIVDIYHWLFEEYGLKSK
jgi:hypothetical protein